MVDTAREPLTIEVRRGRLLESRHRVHAAIADADGKLHEAWGDVDQAIFPRSSVKPIQAIALIESGASDHFQCSAAELALACGSHSGEPFQIRRLQGWLDRLGLKESALECGPRTPLGQKAAAALARDGESPRSIHNDCSGEHVGFLMTALHLGQPLEGYVRADHPVQRQITRTLRELTGYEPNEEAFAIDGCGMPTIAFPLWRLAIAAAHLGAPNGLIPSRRSAIQTIRDSMATAPEMIAGLGRFDTLAMQLLGNKAIVKSGIEGVFLAGTPDFGLFFKVEDGAQRARDLAAANLLRRLGLVDDSENEMLRDFLIRPLHNPDSTKVGEIRTGANW